MKDYEDLDKDDDFVVKGSGGGKAPDPPSEAGNTLRSKAVANFIELLGEGENLGLLNGGKSVYLNSTPLQNEDGTWNFKGISIQERRGTVDQLPLSNVTGSQAEVVVNTEVTKTLGPITRSTTSAILDAVRVRIQISALYEIDDEGNIDGTDVTFRIEWRPQGGNWTTYTGKDIKISGKTNSPYEAAYRINLSGTGPWDIRVTRVSDDSESSKLLNGIIFAAYTEILNEQFTYPYCHVLGVKVDTELFGSSVPTRGYHVGGRIVEVPTNFDPETRTYSGMWNGTWKLACTDDPAWCYRDLLRNTRYGLGRRVPSLYIDDATLYVISQRCAEMVDDGYGNMEHRFSCNLVINTQKEAYDVLNDMASIFFGLTYWAAGTVTLSHDAPADMELLVTNANVVDGEFVWTGTPLRTRANAVIVSYNNKDDLYKQAIEIEQANHLISQYGYRPRQVTAFACNSRGQARRLARWILYSEQMEDATVTYRAGEDHAWVAPGTVIGVLDKNMEQARWSGRAKSYSGTQLIVDSAGPVSGGNTLLFVNLNGQVETRTITSVSGTTFTLNTALPAGLPNNFIWAAQSGTIKPLKMRVLSSRQVEEGVYEVAALKYADDKFAQIDNGLDFVVNPNTPGTAGPIRPPTHLNLTLFSRRVSGSRDELLAMVTWTSAADTRVREYQVQYREGKSGWRALPNTVSNVSELVVTVGQNYQFRVRSVSPPQRTSDWVYTAYITARLPRGSILPVTNFTATPRVRAVFLSWTNPEDTALKGVQIFAGPTNDFAQASLLGVSTGSTYTHVTGDTVQRFYWARTLSHNGPPQASSRVGPITGAGSLVPLVDIDDTPPEIPTGLALSTELLPNGMAKVIATWNASADSVYFDLLYTVAGGNEISATTSLRRHEVMVPRSTLITVQVRAVDRVNNRSLYTLSAQITSAGDNVPPAVPTGLKTIGGFNVIWAQWNANLEADLSHYEVYVSSGTTNPGVGTTPTMVTQGTQIVMTGLAEVATRYFWVRAVDTSGNKSAWTARVTGNTLSIWQPPGVPVAPTGLTLTTRIQGDTVFVRATWNDTTNASTYNLAIAEASQSEIFINVPGTSYEFPALPNTLYSIRVQAMNSGAQKSPWTAVQTITSARDTVPPAVPTGLSIAPAFGAFMLTWTENTEGDLSYYEIMESTANSQTSGTRKTYRSASANVTLSGYAEAVTRYFWVRAVDTSGNASAWTSPSVSATTVSVWSPPNAEVPTGLATSSRNVGGKSYITVTWTGTANAVAYDISITEAGGNEVFQSAGTSPFEFEARAGVQYTIRIRSVNAAGQKSAWTATVNRTALGDSEAPAVPTNLTVTGTFGALWVKWDRNTEADMAYYEVLWNPSASWAPPNNPATPPSQIASNEISITGIDPNQTRYVAVRAVDTSGNKSAWTATVPGTTLSNVDFEITTSDLVGLIDATSFAAGIQPVSIHTGASLPTSKSTEALMWNGKLYRWVASPATGSPRYMANVDATDILGQLAAGQLGVDSVTAGTVAAAAINTRELAANAVTASKMLVMDTTNLVPDPSFLDPATWAFTRVSISTDFSTAPAAVTAPRFLLLNPGAGAWYATIPGTEFIASEGQQFLYTAKTWRNSGTGGTIRIRAVFFDKNGVEITSGTQQSTGDSTGELFSHSLKVTAPAGTVRARFSIYVIGGANSYWGLIEPSVMRRATGELIVDGTLKAIHMAAEEIITGAAQIRNAIIGDAHITQLSAAKLIAGTAMAGSITVSGESLSSIRDKAVDGASALSKFSGAGGTLPPGQVSFNFAASSSKGGKALDTDAVNGTAAATISAATLNFNANNDRLSSTPTAPTHAAAAATILSYTSNTDGSVDIRYQWNYTVTPGTASDIDGFIVFVRASTSSGAYTVTGTGADENPIYVTKDQRSVVLTGVAADKYYTFAVRAYRIVDSDINAQGVLMSGIVKPTVSGTNPYRPSANVAFSGNLTGTINGTEAATVVSGAALGAQDPATRINAGTTKIDPGLITVFGSTTLASWRDPGDLTKIDGGNISANSISSNKLTVGNRSITLTDTRFDCDPATNTVSWTAGYIRWINNNGASATTQVPAGSAVWPGGGAGPVYVYWAQGATELQTTTSQNILADENAIVLASYRGGLTLNADYGRTVVDGSEIRTGTIRAAQLVQTEALITNTAQIANATITEAKITGTLSASILRAGTAFADSITVNGTTLATINTNAATGAQDPAGRINQGTTTIDPGKILISQTTTLADWRTGTNNTEINGGSVAANTITANKLNIGLRGISLSNLKFEANSPANNQVSWTAGSIGYQNNSGTNTTVNVSAGSATWSTGTMYIYWVQGAATLSTTTNFNTARGTNNVIIATYRGGLALNADYGRTVIDGSEIKTGSVRAEQLYAGEIITLSAQIKDAIITSAKIVELDAAKLIAGSTLSSTIRVDGRAIGVLGGAQLLDTMADDWVKVAGSGTMEMVGASGEVTPGNRVLRVLEDGQVHARSPHRVPFDPRKLYKITYSIRRAAAFGGTKGTFMAGVLGMDENGGGVGYNWLRLVDQATVPNVYTDYSIYIKGAEATPSGAGTIASPRTMGNDIRFLCPSVVFNQVASTNDGDYRMLLGVASIEVVNEDAGEIVNAGSTLIEPGRVRISGGVTVADWRQGGDETRISGGRISANTISANKMEIGSRNITLTGVRFQHNTPLDNWVRWGDGNTANNAGYIRWINDAGNVQTSIIRGGQVQWTAGVVYIYWTKGDTGVSLRSTTNLSVAMATDNVILATYEGGTKLDADFGRTIVDGSDIKTGTITAAQLVKTENLITTAAQIGEATVRAIHIGPNALYVPYFWAPAGVVTIPTTNNYQTPRLLMERTVPDFEGGGYVVTFSAFCRGWDAFGTVYLEIDGTKITPQRFGVRADGGSNATYMIPVSTFGSASGYGTTNIKVYAYNSHWNSDTSTSNPYTLQNMRLTLSGTKR